MDISSIIIFFIILVFVVILVQAVWDMDSNPSHLPTESLEVDNEAKLNKQEDFPEQVEQNIEPPTRDFFAIDLNTVSVEDVGEGIHPIILVNSAHLNIENCNDSLVRLSLNNCTLKSFYIQKNDEAGTEISLSAAQYLRIFEDNDRFRLMDLPLPSSWNTANNQYGDINEFDALCRLDGFSNKIYKYIYAKAEVLSKCEIRGKEIVLNIIGDISTPFEYINYDSTETPVSTIKIEIDWPHAAASLVVEEKRNFTLWGDFNWLLELNCQTLFTITGLKENDLETLVTHIKHCYQELHKAKPMNPEISFYKKLTANSEIEIVDGQPLVNLGIGSSVYLGADKVKKILQILETLPEKARTLAKNFSIQNEGYSEHESSNISNLQQSDMEHMTLLIDLTNEYRDILKTKRNHLVWFDEYDVPKESDWENEIIKFLTTRVFPNTSRLPLTFDKCKAVITEIIGGYSKPTQVKKEIDSLSGLEYEQFCADILNSNNWKANVTQGTGDQGADIIASMDGHVIALQCKRYGKPVGNKAVQEIFAALSHYGADTGYVVSNQSFTPSAQKLASSTGIILIHHDQLEKITAITRTGI